MPQRAVAAGNMKRRDLTCRVLAALACGPGGLVPVAAQPATRLFRVGVLRFGVPGDDSKWG